MVGISVGSVESTTLDFHVKSTNCKLSEEYVRQQDLANTYGKMTSTPMYYCGPEKGRFSPTLRN